MADRQRRSLLDTESRRGPGVTPYRRVKVWRPAIAMFSLLLNDEAACVRRHGVDPERLTPEMLEALLDEDGILDKTYLVHPGYI